MAVSTHQQLRVFFLFLAFGMVCGMFFDVQRFLRKIVSAGNTRTMLEDGLFISFFTLAAIGTSICVNNGEVRYYEVMGAVSGVLFYAAVLSRPFIMVLSFFLKLIKKLFLKPLLKILEFLARPVKNFVRTLRKCTLRLRRKIKNILRKAKKRKKLIKKRGRML